MISDLLEENNIDIFGICESWLLPDIPDSFVSIGNFNISRADSKSNSRKHGVCVFIKSHISHICINTCCDNVCAIHLLAYNLYIIVIYRPPSNSSEDNQALLNFLLDFCPGKEILLLGDFNLPLLNWKSKAVLSAKYPPLHQSFINCFISLGLHQWIDTPTYISSGNILDLAFTSERDRVGEVEVGNPLPNCGHCPVILTYYFQSGVTTENVDLPKRSWHRAKYNKINDYLLEVDWQFELQNLTLDSMYGRFLSISRPLIDLYVPLSPCTPPTLIKSPPKALKTSRRQAWRAYKNARNTYGRHSTQASQALANYDDINNTFRNFFTSIQIDYEKSLIQKLQSSSKPFHQYIRRKKVGTPSVGPLRMDSGELSSDCTKMANTFADHFCSVYSSQVSDAPSPHQIFDGSIDDIPITLQAVQKKIEALDPNSSMGPDGIHPNLLKSCPAVVLPLFLIFQKSLLTGKLPKEWKKSTIVPIFKKGSRHTPLNYRPISLTSVCCKTLERLISECLYNFLDTNRLLSSDQFGFRQGRTVDDQLLLVYNDVTAWIDAGYVVDVVLFDFSKAFDVVNHSLLIEKLRLIGLRGALLSWIKDFLLGRTMQVTVSGCISSSKDVLSGVPQGSVLGPLLFLIYVNFLPSYIQSKCKFFADDLKIYLKLRSNSHSSLAADVNICQRDIDEVHRVADSWGLHLNLTKCAVLRCQRGSVDWDNIGPLQRYHLNNTILTIDSSHKDLGITVDNTLKFHSHIAVTVKKAAGLANNLLKSTLCRDKDFMVTLFKSHIRPLIEFGSTVWNTGYLNDLKLLESTQRRWTKYITGLSDLSYADRLRALNLYSVRGRLIRADLIKCWKIFHNQSSLTPHDIFTLSPITHTRGHRFKVAKPHISIECRRRFFSIRCIDLWNSLSDEAVSCNSIPSFKKYLHVQLGQTLFDYVD